MIRKAIVFLAVITVSGLMVYGIAVARSTGRPALWYATTSLPAPRRQGSALAHGDRIYYLGDYHGTYISSQIYVASLEGNGAISSWWRTLDLPTPLTGLSAVVYNDRLYVLGGWMGGQAAYQVSIQRKFALMEAW
jgi:hypothetical protein